MPSSELENLLKVLSTFQKSNHYTTYIEVSTKFYVYLRQQAQRIRKFDISAYPETLCGYEVFLNNELKNYEYRITRRGNDNE